MLKLIRYLKGYLSIKVWGFSTERFMNLCSHHNIFLWNIKNHGDYNTMCVSLNGFYRLRTITRKTGTRVVITKRYGLPFLIPRIRKRKIFIMGFLGSMLFWIWMSGFIWNIEIEGNLYVTDDVFRDFLQEQGIEEGIKKKNLEIEVLEKAIRNEYDIITWTSARVDGTKLIIWVKENDLQLPSKEEEAEKDDTIGYDLVAQREGTVVGIITRSGMPLVKEGDCVEKGMVLVEGAIPIYNEDTTVKKYEYCKADADILLKSTLEEVIKIPATYEKKEYTGREKSRSFFLLGQLKLQIPFGKISYEKYDVIEEKEQISLFGSWKLPFYVGKDRIREYKAEEKVYTKGEIKVEFEEKIQKIIQTLEEKGVQIIEKNVTIKKCKNIWEMYAEFVIIESTGVLKKTQVVLPNENDKQGEEWEAS